MIICIHIDKEKLFMLNSNQNIKNLSTSKAALEMDRLWRNCKVETDAMKKFWDLFRESEQ